MQINVKLDKNAFQIQCLTIVTVIVGILTTIIGSSAIGSSDFLFQFYFIAVCSCWNATLILMLETALDISADPPFRRILKFLLHSVGGWTITIILLCNVLRYFQSSFEVCAVIMGYINAPLHLLIAWKLNNPQELEQEQSQSTFIHFSISHDPPNYSNAMEDRVLTIPPKYSEVCDSITVKRKGYNNGEVSNSHTG